jgi:hypothetical protein
MSAENSNTAGVLNEIIVTSPKRSKSLQDMPIALVANVAGFDADLPLAVTSNIDLSFGIGYLDTEFKEYIGSTYIASFTTPPPSEAPDSLACVGYQLVSGDLLPRS